MSQTQANIAEPCPGCGAGNEPGMSFCMYCGKSLSRQAISEPLEERGRPCPNCGKVDYLSNVFCVMCGADMTLTQEPVDVQFAAAVNPEKPKQPGLLLSLLSRHHFLLAAVTGVILGLPLSLWLVNPVLERTVAQSSWPRSGLVVYATPPRAQVVLEESSGARFMLGQTGPGGELAIPDLPPGSYRVTMDSPGLRSVMHEVQIESNKVSVLGFPNRIELTR